MIPTITAAALSRAIATVRMVEAGRDYWRRGLVGALHCDDEAGIVRTTVKGSSRTPYRVELRFGAGLTIATTCSCPVGIGCKHAAATLFALQDDQALDAGSGGLLQQPASLVVTVPAAPILAADLLPASLS